MRLLALVTLASLVALPAVAAPKVGDALPRLVLAGGDQGVLEIKGDDPAYSRFDSNTALSGKVSLVTYMAARQGAKKSGDTLKKAMRGSGLKGAFRPVRILNVDDCALGTCGMARSSFEDSRKGKPGLFVVDDDGKGRKVWGAPKEGMLLIVVGPDRTVLAAESSPLSAAAAQRLVAALKAATGKN